MFSLNIRLSRYLDRQRWFIPACFVVMCLLIVVIVVGLILRRFQDVPPQFAFSIGAELCALVVATLVTLSILPSANRDRESGYNRSFVTVLFAGCVCMGVDAFQMLVDGIPELWMLNRVLSVFIFFNIAFFAFFFFRYAMIALKSESKIVQVLMSFAYIGAPVFASLSFVNFFTPLYFTIDPTTGLYARYAPTWWLSQVFIIFLIIALILGVILSKEKIKDKLVIMAFIGIPLAAVACGGWRYGISVQYTAMVASLVLIYGLLFSENERNLYTTGRELGVAQKIQKQMLPSIFPAFPERKDFDIFASMNPAKEVGGDFYDFFLVDDDHLCMVMADVSGKGIPAALFMMASKIILANNAKLGKSPAQILTDTNAAICANNKEEMFVTVWLGILEISTGKLTAANAGHEYPVIKKTDGKFELLKDKHGFVIGGMDGIRYKEYEIRMEPGSKLFLYTDGVPEATDATGELFGTERMLSALNMDADAAPENILKQVRGSVDSFVKEAEQFDDLTMLCLEYRGNGQDKEFTT